MLVAAQYKYHYTEEQSEVFTDLVRILIVALNTDVDEYIAQDAQNKEAYQAVIGLDLAESDGLLGDRGDPGRIYNECCEHSAYEIAEPYDRDLNGVIKPVLKNITDLAGEQLQSKGAHTEETTGEEKGPNYLALLGQKYHSAKADAHSGKNCRNQGLKVLHLFCHNALSLYAQTAVNFVSYLAGLCAIDTYHLVGLAVKLTGNLAVS